MTVLSLNTTPGLNAEFDAEAWHNANAAYLERMIQYCFDHTDRILTGGNPVQDLINAGLIPHTFDNFNCAGAQKAKEVDDENMRKIREFNESAKFLDDISGLEKAFNLK